MKKLPSLLTALFLFLLPLKFGGLAVMPESGGFYPENFADWLFISWHPHSLGFFGAALLVIVLAFYREKLKFKELIFTLSWSLLPALAVIPGVIGGEWIIAVGEWSMLLGCGCVVTAAALIVNKEPEKALLFGTALLAGGIACAFYGWHQHLYSLNEMRAFVAEQEAQGIPVSEAMRLKLTDPRIYSTLASSNTFAAYLMIMLVVSFYFAEVWSRKISPPRQAKFILRGAFLLLFVSVLLLTRSRSMVFCPVAAGMLALFSSELIKWKWRIAGLAAGIVMLAAGTAAGIAAGRGVASMGERVDYLRTSAIMCAATPVTGGGWGGFFRTHMQIKASEVGETARDPHNVVAKFASQCGIPAGIIMLWVLLCPLVILWKQRFEKNFAGMVFWCGVIFTFHSLIDCDWQVPALIAAMGVLYACAIAQLPESEKAPRAAWMIYPAAVIMITGSCWASYWYLAGDKALSRLQDKINPATREVASRLAYIPVETLAKEAEKYRPAQAVIPMYCGDWYLRTGELDRAEKQFLRALELDPLRPAAYGRLARIAMLRNERQKAEKLLEKAREIFPKGKQYTSEKFFSGTENRIL